VLAGKTRDISLTGLSVELPSAGDSLTEKPRSVVLRVMPGNGRVISIRGEVEWMVEANPKVTLGVKFTFEELGRLLLKESKAS
jgi:hypothetical protein